MNQSVTTAPANPTAFVVQTPALEPAKTGTAMVVHRPPPSQVALRVHETVQALATTMQDVAYGGYGRTPQIPTDNWPIPALLGGVAAVSTAMFFGEVGVISYLAASAGVIGTAIMGALHPAKKRAAIAALPGVLNNDKRTALLALAAARTNFEQAPGGAKLDAPIVDVALAKTAKTWLDQVRRNGVNDPELEKILADYANLSASADKEDQELLDLIDQLTTTHPYYLRQKFSELPDDKQKALAPFVRQLLFTEDGAKGNGEYRTLMPLFEALEAIDPATARSVEAHPTHVPAAVANHLDAIVTLANTASFASKLEGKRGEQWSYEPAQKFAIADERTGIERVLIAAICERTLEDWDKRGYFGLRARAALKGLIALRDAEPANVRAEANDLLQNVDTLFSGDSTRSGLEKTVALMKLHRSALSGGS